MDKRFILNVSESEFEKLLHHCLVWVVDGFFVTYDLNKTFTVYNNRFQEVLQKFDSDFVELSSAELDRVRLYVRLNVLN